MATIKLTDTSSIAINATVADDSILGKTPAAVVGFLRSDVIGAMDQTLDKVQIDSLSIGFSYNPAFSLTGGTAQFTAGGSSTGEIDLYKPAGTGTPSPLFPVDQFGTNIEMADNYYLALSFQLALGSGISMAPGAFALTPAISATGNAKIYLPFGRDGNGTYPKLRSALETLYSSFELPSSIDDIKGLPTGAVFVYNTHGTVAFQAQFDVLAAVCPTATPGISTSYGPINIQAGPSVTIGGGFSLSGEFKVRIWKKGPNAVQIGYYKKHGASFAVSFDASAGIDVTTRGGYDVISKVYSLLGDSGKLDSAWLQANVPASVADDVQNAYQSAVQTKLSISIDEECDTSITDEAAFSWNFDLAAMDSAAQASFVKLIGGNLSSLMSGQPLPAGITKAGSIFDRIKETKHTFTFNFLGLFDHASVQDSTLGLSTKITEDGQLIMTDTAHLNRLSATATPFVKSDQLRKVFTEDCVATVGYSVSFGNFVPNLKVAYSYFNYKDHAKTSDLSLFVSTATELGESTVTSDWQQVLNSGAPSQQASMLASLGYDGMSGRNLFLDQNANPRSTPDFEKIGRLALLRTPGLNLHPGFIQYLQDDAKWKKLRDGGTAQAFYSTIGVDLINPPQSAVVSFSYTLHIVFWASAMHSTGQALQAVLQYLAQNSDIYPLHDKGFLDRRQTFASQLKNAIQKTPMFNDALGLMTMFLAATPANKNVAITYGGKTKTYA
jgi:hypothetical protein